jgi:RNA polymerase sigma factor (sigma-70 family)
MSGAPFTEYLTAARQGDKHALGELLRVYYPTVQGLVHRSLAGQVRPRKPHLMPAFSTGDIVQEVFLNVIRGLEQFEGMTEESFVSFLVTAIRNRLVDSMRFHEADRRDRRRTTDDSASEFTPGTTTSPPDKAANAEQLETLRKVLATFPERERLLLRERLERELPFAEIATMLGYPSEDAARKAFNTANAKLSVRLRSAGVRKDA